MKYSIIFLTILLVPVFVFAQEISNVNRVESTTQINAETQTGSAHVETQTEVIINVDSDSDATDEEHSDSVRVEVQTSTLPNVTSDESAENTGIEHEDIGTAVVETSVSITINEERVELVDRLNNPEDTTSRAVFIKIGDIKGEAQDTSSGGGSGEIIIVGGVPSSAKKPKEIVVVGSKVRGWDPVTKEEVLGAAPRDAQLVETSEDLALFTVAEAEKHVPMESVTFNFEKIKMEYQSQGILLGFIPLSFRLTVDADSETGDVKVRFPWYRFLMKSAVSESVLESDVRTALDQTDFVGLNPQPDPPSAEADGEDLVGLNPQPDPPSSNVMRRFAVGFETILNTLKVSHYTAMNSVRNLK